MQRSAVIVHLDGIPGVTPLVGAYLKAYAFADEAVRASWRIELYSASCQIKASHVIRHLVRAQPDLVAFSVYTWNVGLVRRLLPALRGLLPRARFLLGGVEVVNAAPRYVDASWENVAVCNGEGERSFRQVLLELGQERPDWARVDGLSYARDGVWHTTPGKPRIEDLSELASPWLSGVLDDVPLGEVALFETNRGCPFACEFCYWGGAIGQKVYRQDVERLKAELEYIGKRGVRVISIVDANFGILPQDIELAEHLVELNRQGRGPNRIVFNSSKVRPDRVEQISGIFADAGMLTRHVFSLQSMSPHVLATAKRTSLEREPYRAIQRRLNQRRMSSIVELLWPMPGETLESFKQGVDELLGMGAQGFLVYPLVWLNNTGYGEHTEEYGVVTLPEDDPAGAGRLVVETREAPFSDYLEGLQFSLALYMLHDCRGLYATLQLLDALRIARFRDALEAFAHWMNTRATGPLAELWRARIDCFEEMAKYIWRGALADALLHAQRQDYDRLLRDFVAEQRDWTGGEHGELIAQAAEYDLVCRPLAFLQTPFELGVELERLELLESRARQRRVRASYDFPSLIEARRQGEALPAQALEPGERVLVIDHRKQQLFLRATRTPNEHHWICTHAVQEIARIEPRCALEAADAHSAAPA